MADDVRIRWPEPADIEDEKVRDYLHELIRTLDESLGNANTAIESVEDTIINTSALASASAGQLLQNNGSNWVPVDQIGTSNLEVCAVTNYILAVCAVGASNIQTCAISADHLQNQIIGFDILTTDYITSATSGVPVCADEINYYDASAATVKKTPIQGVLDLINSVGRIINIQSFATVGSALYTATSGTIGAWVFVAGGSGGGGGAVTASASGGDGGTSYFGTYCSASGGIGGDAVNANRSGRGLDGTGVNGDINTILLAGGAGGYRYVGGSQWDFGQDGGFGGLAIKYLTSVATSVDVFVGAGGTAGNSTFVSGVSGENGFVIIAELS